MSRRFATIIATNQPIMPMGPVTCVNAKREDAHQGPQAGGDV